MHNSGQSYFNDAFPVVSDGDYCFPKTRPVILAVVPVPVQMRLQLSETCLQHVQLDIVDLRSAVPSPWPYFDGHREMAGQEGNGVMIDIQHKPVARSQLRRS